MGLQCKPFSYPVERAYEMTITAYFNLFQYLIENLVEFPPTLLVFSIFFLSYGFYIFYRFLYGNY